MPAIVEVIDRYGRRRRLRPGEIPADGETIHVPMMLMDHAGFCPYFSDGSPDLTHPCKPSFRFADTNDAARLAADAAYQQMRERLSNAWRNKDHPHDDQRTPQRTLDELRAAAEQAWEERSARMRNAWRQR